MSVIQLARAKVAEINRSGIQARYHILGDHCSEGHELIVIQRGDEPGGLVISHKSTDWLYADTERLIGLLDADFLEGQHNRGIFKKLIPSYAHLARLKETNTEVIYVWSPSVFMIIISIILNVPLALFRWIRGK